MHVINVIFSKEVFQVNERTKISEIINRGDKKKGHGV